MSLVKLHEKIVYVQTLIREAKEEIYLDIDEKDIKFIANVTYEENGYKQNIYLLKTDITPEFNPNDFISAKWLTPAELTQAAGGRTFQQWQDRLKQWNILVEDRPYQ